MSCPLPAVLRIFVNQTSSNQGGKATADAWSPPPLLGRSSLQLSGHNLDLEVFWTALPSVGLVVGDVCGRLFAQFQVQGGTIRLAGFSVQPRPVFVCLSSHPSGGWKTIAILDETGVPVAAALQEVWHEAERLGDWLGQSRPVNTNARSASELPDKDSAGQNAPGQRHGQCPSPAAPNPVEAAREVLGEACSRQGRPFLLTMSSVLILPLDYVQGKLVFTIGDRAVESPFEQWGLVLLRNPSWCQPYHCPHSGAFGKKLAADDEGEISLASQLDRCDLSGKTLHRFKLRICGNSGRKVRHDQAIPSATNPDWMCPKHVTVCRQCSLAVVAGDLIRGRCRACRRPTARLSAADPAASLEIRARYRPFAKTHPEFGLDQLRDLSYFGNDRWHWFFFRTGTRQHTVVLDAAGTTAAHRVREFWQWKWRDLNAQVTERPGHGKSK